MVARNIKAGLNRSESDVLLKENQNYDLVRRCVISFFAKDPEILEQYGYSISDFQPAMSFVKDLYYEHCKRKVDSQCLNP